MVVNYVRSFDLVPPERWMIRLDPESETLGPILRRLRDDRGWTLYELARRVYPDRANESREMKNKESLLSRYETNQMKNPDPAVLDRLEDVYGLPRDTLTLAHSRTQRYLRMRESIPASERTVIIPDEPELIEAVNALFLLEDHELGHWAELIRLQANQEKQPERLERHQAAS